MGDIAGEESGLADLAQDHGARFRRKPALGQHAAGRRSAAWQRSSRPWPAGLASIDSSSFARLSASAAMRSSAAGDLVALIVLETGARTRLQFGQAVQPRQHGRLGEKKMRFECRRGDQRRRRRRRAGACSPRR
jgi:hypothetical protein